MCLDCKCVKFLQNCRLISFLCPWSTSQWWLWHEQKPPWPSSAPVSAMILAILNQEIGLIKKGWRLLTIVVVIQHSVNSVNSFHLSWAWSISWEGLREGPFNSPAGRRSNSPLGDTENRPRGVDTVCDPSSWSGWWDFTSWVGISPGWQM